MSLRIPPGILHALPEQPRLPDPPDLIPPRHNPFLPVLPHQLPQRIHQLRPLLLQPLKVRPQLRRPSAVPTL